MNGRAGDNRTHSSLGTRILTVLFKLFFKFLEFERLWNLKAEFEWIGIDFSAKLGQLRYRVSMEEVFTGYLMRCICVYLGYM